MAWFLKEEEIGWLLRMDDAISAVEEAFRELSEGNADNRPRSRVHLPGGILHVMAAGSLARRALGLKCYTSTKSGARFLFLLYDGTTGELLAVMEANRLGQIRTGAASGVATRHLAQPGASRVGIYGTGWQARSQLEAMAVVRPVEKVVAFGRNAERRAAFCREMSDTLGVEVHAAATPSEVCKGADIVITATTSRDPVLRGEWLVPGVHVNAIGSNAAGKQEIDDQVVVRSAVIAVDSLEQARIECGDLIDAIQKGRSAWDEVVELGDVVNGISSGRSRPDDITLFESQGIALEDVAVADHVFRLAREEGLGQRLPF